MTRPVAAAGAAGTDSAVRSSAFALITQFTTAAFTAVLTLFLARVLGPDDFGLFALALSAGTLLFVPSDFGVSQSAARFIAEHRSDRAAVRAVLSTALRLKLVAGALVSLALFAAAGPIADAYDEPGLGWPLRWIALSIFVESLFAFYRYAFIALNRVPATLRMVLSESAVETGASICLVLLAGGAAAAAGGRAVGYAFGVLVAVAMTLRLLGRRRAAETPPPEVAGFRRVARYAGTLFVVETVFVGIVQVDVLLIGAILGTASVGFFQATMRLAVFLHYPGLAAATGVAPRMARGAGQSPDIPAFQATLRLLILFQALMVAPLIVWADPIIELLLGPEYERSADVLVALAPYIFLSGLAPLVSTAVTYLGEARRRVPIAVATLAISIALALALLDPLGVVGAAIALDFAYLVYVPAHYLICRQMLELPLLPTLRSLARGLLSAAAMAAVLLAFGTSDLSALEWLAGGAAGTLAFCAVILATREVAPGEVRPLIRLLIHRVRRPPGEGEPS